MDRLIKEEVSDYPGLLPVVSSIKFFFRFFHTLLVVRGFDGNYYEMSHVCCSVFMFRREHVKINARVRSAPWPEPATKTGSYYFMVGLIALSCLEIRVKANLTVKLSLTLLTFYIFLNVICRLSVVFCC